MRSTESSLKFVYSRQHWQTLYLIPQVSHSLSSCWYLHLILQIPLARLSTTFYNKFDINLVLSINWNLYDLFLVISFPFLSIPINYFCVATVNVMCFSVFSRKQVNCSSNSSTSYDKLINP